MTAAPPTGGAERPDDQRPVAQPAARPGPVRDPGVAGVHRRVVDHAGQQPGAVPAAQRAAAGARAPRRCRRICAAPTISTRSRRSRAGVPRRRAHRAADPGLHPLERRGHGAPGATAGHRRRRAHLHLRRPPRRSTRSASTTSSAATTHPGGGDQIYFQGHASPGIYARAFLEGRLTERQLDGFRQELSHAGRRACRRTRTRG